jgi:1-acyl-sn-glycerol-3-phosphate acyltransferase
LKLLRNIALLFYTVWAYLTFFLLGMVCVVIYAFILVFAKEKKVQKMLGWSYRYARVWGAINGVSYDISGKENLDTQHTCVICVNHRGIADLFILPASLKNVNYRPLSKKELGEIPIIGFLFRNALIMIDRSSAESRKKGVETLKKLMDDEGVSPLIFPEGTRNRTDKPLKEFYDGAFRIAIETQVPIMPVVLLNVDKISPQKTFLLSPGKLYSKFLKPIPTTGLTINDVDALKQQVFDLMWRETEAFIAVHGNR